jgi:SAM-dependent methyltransferase
VVDADTLNFACALARQCFINEYVFDESEHEREQAGALRDRLVTALQSDGPIHALWLAAVASYIPLHSLPGADGLARRGWPQMAAGVLAQQVQEPNEEQRLRSSIPLLTPIVDDVSRSVGRQYEENPYPRWPEPMPPSNPSSFDDHTSLQFPRASFCRLGKANPDILIAGCGTGRQSIGTAQNIVGAQVLAIDLSLTSLAYAKRKTLALGLRNIEYAQADILQLGSIGRTFDVIEAGGVLHHMADPWTGWRVLLALLRPGGCMRIGLYSALARPAVVAARRFIAERGYGTTANDIRKCRQELMNLPDGAPMKILVDSSDFFNISGCRDLMFHVQEHQVTLPAIKSFLIENDLEFLGFVEMDAGTIREYGRRFPADDAMTDLDLWHRFETEHPHTFAGMYMFVVQKKPQSEIASD